MRRATYISKVNNIKSAGEIILQSLMEMIYEGELKPNQALRQEEIAGWFEVSRVPVRDALQKLIEVGLAVKIPRHGVRVANFSIEMLRKLYEVRIILEGAAMELVVHNINDEIMNELKELVEKQKIAMKYKNVKEALKIDNTFHEILLSEATLQNDVLSKLIYSIRLRIKHARNVARNQGKPKEWIQNSINRHIKILETLKAKDENRAKKIMIQIINESMSEASNFVEKYTN